MPKDRYILKDLEVEEVSLVDKPAIGEEFKVIKAKSPTLMTQEQICHEIAEQFEGDSFCYEILEGNRAVVRVYKEDETETYIVPFTIEGETVNVDMNQKREATLVWSIGPVAKSVYSQQPRAEGFIGRLLKRAGWNDNVPPGCGSAVEMGGEPQTETTEEEMKPEEVQKALEEALAPITERLNALEQAPAPEPPAEPVETVESVVSKALAPMLDRIERIEKARGLSAQPNVETTTEVAKQETGVSFAGVFM
jgi:hypothetical protein